MLPEVASRCEKSFRHALLSAGCVVLPGFETVLTTHSDCNLLRKVDQANLLLANKKEWIHVFLQ